MNITTKKKNVMAAIKEAGWADCITGENDTSVTLSVSDDEAQDAMDEMKKQLPDYAVADHTGNSNTSGDGDTTEDIKVSW